MDPQGKPLESSFEGFLDTLPPLSTETRAKYRNAFKKLLGVAAGHGIQISSASHLRVLLRLPSSSTMSTHEKRVLGMIPSFITHLAEPEREESEKALLEHYETWLKSQGSLDEKGVETRRSGLNSAFRVLRERGLPVASSAAVVLQLLKGDVVSWKDNQARSLKSFASFLGQDPFSSLPAPKAGTKRPRSLDDHQQQQQQQWQGEVQVASRKEDQTKTWLGGASLRAEADELPDAAEAQVAMDVDVPGEGAGLASVGLAGPTHASPSGPYAFPSTTVHLFPSCGRDVARYGEGSSEPAGVPGPVSFGGFGPETLSMSTQVSCDLGLASMVQEVPYVAEQWWRKVREAVVPVVRGAMFNRGQAPAPLQQQQQGQQGQPEPEPRVLFDGPVPDGVDLGPVCNLAFMYGVSIDAGGPGYVTPVAVATFRGTGKVEVLVNCTESWVDSAKAALLCIRRLRQRLQMRDMWHSSLDIYIGAPYVRLELSGGSGSAAIAAAVVHAGFEEKGRKGWAVTGCVSIGGDIGAVASVREKAVATWRAGFKGLVLPGGNLKDLTGDWPGEKEPTEQMRQDWIRAKQELLFKPVFTIEGLLSFLFPALAERLAAGQGGGVPAAPAPKRRGRSGRSAPSKRIDVVPAAGCDVGPVLALHIPMWGANVGGSMLFKAEACVVRGGGPPEVTGGFVRISQNDFKMARTFLDFFADSLGTLCQSLTGQGLAFDPKKPGNFHIHVNMHVPDFSPGYYVMPMFIVVAAVMMGVKVKADRCVAGFCSVNGIVGRLGNAVIPAVKSAKKEGMKVLYLPHADVEAVSAMEESAGLQLRGIKRVDELLTADLFEV